MRINKYLAHMGFSTRRGADALIESGKVFVNGKRAKIGQQIEAEDKVVMKNAPTPEYRYILYNKPRNVITHSPGEGETDIVTKLKDDHNIDGVFPVGRLDKNSEGLILLTNDGRVTERLLSPDADHEKEYEITVDKKVSNWFIRHLSEGVVIEGYKTKPARAEAMKRNDHMLTLVLTEGKKHQVRRMCAALGYQVESLRRTRIMDLKLRTLKPGQYYELKGTDASAFRASVGLK